jgi:hypothetical protein
MLEMLSLSAKSNAAGVSSRGGKLNSAHKGLTKNSPVLERWRLVIGTGNP